MKKIALCFLLSVASAALFAQNGKQELLQTVQSQGIAQELDGTPDGTTMRLTPDGGFQIFAVGTGTYDFDDVDDVMQAQNEATLKAKANLAKFMNESISTDEKIESMSKKIKTISSKDGETSATVNKVSAKNALSTIKSSSSALLKGVIVLASSKVPGTGTSGTYRVMVGVSSKTLGAVNKLVTGMDQAEAAAAEAETATAATAAPAAETSAAAAPAAAAPAGLPAGWIECVGQGMARSAAVSAALAEGIQQVYGLALQQDTKLKERMKKVRVNSDLQRVSSKEVESDTLTKTAGFVKEFRIVNVKDLGGGKVEVVIHANIVNPRAGGVVAIMLHKPDMPLEDLTKNYDLGPNRRLSGSEISSVVGKTFNRAFANANKFLVLDMEDLANVVGQQALSKKMVEAGLAPSSELMKAGQLLTADYILTSTIEELKYSRKLGMNRRSRKFEPVYQMSIRMNYKLTDVTTGRSVLSNVISAKLSNDEISYLLEQDEECDLLLALMAKVTAILNGAIPQK